MATGHEVEVQRSVRYQDRAVDALQLAHVGFWFDVKLPDDLEEETI